MPRIILTTDTTPRRAAVRASLTGSGLGDQMAGTSPVQRRLFDSSSSSSSSSSSASEVTPDLAPSRRHELAGQAAIVCGAVLLLFACILPAYPISAGGLQLPLGLAYGALVSFVISSILLKN